MLEYCEDYPHKKSSFIPSHFKQKKKKSDLDSLSASIFDFSGVLKFNMFHIYLQVTPACNEPS